MPVAAFAGRIPAMLLRFVFALGVIVMMTSAFPVHASAQTCHGGVPFEERVSLQVGGSVAGIWSPETVAGGSGRLNVGYRQVFGGSEIFGNHAVSIDSNSHGMSFFGGVRFKLGKLGEICPEANYERSITQTLVPLYGPKFPLSPGEPQLPDSFTLADQYVSKSFGAAVGVPIWKRGRVSVVPTASFVVTSSSLISRSSPSPDTIVIFRDDQPSLRVATLQVGCGIVVGRRIAFIGGLTRPVWASGDLDKSTNLFGLVALNLMK